MQKGGDHLLLVEPGLRGEIKHIDPAEGAIRRLADQFLDCGCGTGIGRLPQDREQILGFAHGQILMPAGGRLPGELPAEEKFSGRQRLVIAAAPSPDRSHDK